MDFHGSLELMIFDDHVKVLEEMNLEEPVALTINVSKTEQFTRINARKILTLDEARKQKVDIRKEKPKEALPKKEESLVVEINPERNASLIDAIREVAIDSVGDKKLLLKIIGTKEWALIDTNMLVSESFLHKLSKYVSIGS